MQKLWLIAQAEEAWEEYGYPYTVEVEIEYETREPAEKVYSAARDLGSSMFVGLIGTFTVKDHDGLLRSTALYVFAFRDKTAAMLFKLQYGGE